MKSSGLKRVDPIRRMRPNMLINRSVFCSRLEQRLQLRDQKKLSLFHTEKKQTTTSPPRSRLIRAVLAGLKIGGEVTASLVACNNTFRTHETIHIPLGVYQPPCLVGVICRRCIVVTWLVTPKNWSPQHPATTKLGHFSGRKSHVQVVKCILF